MSSAVRMYLKWLLANAIGQGLALGLILEFFRRGLFPASGLLQELAYGALMGGLFGGAQYIAIRREIAPGRQWVAVTAAAGALALPPASYATLVFLLVQAPVIAGVAGGAILGGVTGIAQALVLKGRIRSPWGWPLLSALAMILGLIACGVVVYLSYPFLIGTPVVGYWVPAAVCGTVYGGLTGWFLTWARLRPAPGQPSRPSPLPAEAPSEMP